jgi:hypothetical protein
MHKQPTHTKHGTSQLNLFFKFKRDVLLKKYKTLNFRDVIIILSFPLHNNVKHITFHVACVIGLGITSYKSSAISY